MINAFKLAGVVRELDKMIFKENPAEVRIRVGRENNNDIKFTYIPPEIPNGDFYYIETNTEKKLQRINEGLLCFEAFMNFAAYLTRKRVQRLLNVNLISPEDLKRLNILIRLREDEITDEKDFDATVIACLVSEVIWPKTKDLSEVARIVVVDAKKLIRV